MATKKFRPSKNKDSQPPSRQWLARENRRKLWLELVKFNGSSTGSLELDEKLKKEFGGFKNDNTVGNFRLTDGNVLESGNSEPVDFDMGQVYR